MFSWVFRRRLLFVAIVLSWLLDVRGLEKGERAWHELLNVMEKLLARMLDVWSRITLVMLQSISWFVEAAAELPCLIVIVWYRDLTTANDNPHEIKLSFSRSCRSEILL